MRTYIKDAKVQLIYTSLVHGVDRKLADKIYILPC